MRISNSFRKLDTHFIIGEEKQLVLSIIESLRYSSKPNISDLSGVSNNAIEYGRGFRVGTWRGPEGGLPLVPWKSLTTVFNEYEVDPPIPPLSDAEMRKWAPPPEVIDTRTNSEENSGRALDLSGVNDISNAFWVKLGEPQSKEAWFRHKKQLYKSALTDKVKYVDVSFRISDMVDWWKDLISFKEESQALGRNRLQGDPFADVRFSTEGINVGDFISFEGSGGREEKWEVAGGKNNTLQLVAKDDQNFPTVEEPGSTFEIIKPLESSSNLTSSQKFKYYMDEAKA